MLRHWSEFSLHNDIAQFRFTAVSCMYICLHGWQIFEMSADVFKIDWTCTHTLIGPATYYIWMWRQFKCIGIYLLRVHVWSDSRWCRHEFNAFNLTFLLDNNFDYLLYREICWRNKYLIGLWTITSRVRFTVAISNQILFGYFAYT